MSQAAPSAAPSPPQTRDYQSISDYGIIGDLRSAALIASDGSIDWACLPWFDSPAVFLRLLDREKGGYCAIRLPRPVATTRHYLEGTNILETTFNAASGSVVVTDFMPLGPTSDNGRLAGRIVRLFRCTSGSVDLTIDIKPTFAFASEATRIHSWARGEVVFKGRDHTFLAQAPNIEAAEDGRAVASFRLAAGATESVTLCCSLPGEPIHRTGLQEPLAALEETRRYWTDWSARLQYRGDYRQEIVRSLLALKLLIFAPTGAIVAAPTTSLPEIMGGSRNWDYRLSWIRDSQFMLTALMHCGYSEEAHRFFHFLRKAAKGPADQIQILYDIRGQRSGEETALNFLDGYRHSQPVRVGNAASRQKQSDIYGELLNCMYIYCRMDVSEARKKERLDEVWPETRAMADYVAQHWQEPDQGIWESRNAAQQFVHSKAMCWTALDRAIRLAPAGNATSEADYWRRERDTIFKSLTTHGFNKTTGAFMQAYGSDVLDAAVLRLPLQGVLEATDPRMRSTVEQLEKSLLRNGLLYRNTDAANENEAGSFTICTLWLIDYYTLIGNKDRARDMLNHLLTFQSKLGLFSEEIAPDTGEQLGNFPQALSHGGLIGAILHLEGGPRPGALQGLK